MELSLIKKKLLRNIRLFSLCLLYLIFFIPWLNAQQLRKNYYGISACFPSVCFT